MVNDPDRNRGTPTQNRRGTIAGLVVIAIVAGALFWLVSAIQKHNEVQNCIDSGRRDCVPLPGQ